MSVPTTIPNSRQSHPRAAVLQAPFITVTVVQVLNHPLIFGNQGKHNS